MAMGSLAMGLGAARIMPLGQTEIWLCILGIIPMKAKGLSFPSNLGWSYFSLVQRSFGVYGKN
jgi:hypothetical protein